MKQNRANFALVFSGLIILCFNIWTIGMTGYLYELLDINTLFSGSVELLYIITVFVNALLFLAIILGTVFGTLGFVGKVKAGFVKLWLVITFLLTEALYGIAMFTTGFEWLLLIPMVSVAILTLVGLTQKRA